jgi:hypothetical protein
MLQSFIRSSRLRAWLAKPDCPPAIRECQRLFNRLFSSHLDDLPVEDAHFPEVHGMHGMHKTSRRFKYDGVNYATSSTHIGNSLILFYPNGDRSQSPVPASITNIFITEEMVTFVVFRHLQASSGTVDPFHFFPDLSIALYSSRLSNTPENVNVEWVLGHFARFAVSAENVAVVSLSRVKHSSFSMPCLLTAR